MYDREQPKPQLRLNEKTMVLACDRWTKVEHNLWAIACTIGAQRGCDPLGCGRIEQAFAGLSPGSTFVLLSAPGISTLTVTIWRWGTWTNLDSPMDDVPKMQARITAGQVFGVTLGNALEFYDFLVFSFFALQIGQTFFPATNPASSLLATLATFGAGFLTRPLGAVVLGILGDRVGRKPMMMLSFALIGVATLGLACVPAYSTTRIAAPILVVLCRLLQGFALGGEVGSSTAILAEASPARRRGLYISMQFAGQGAAVLASGIIGVGLSSVMNDAALAVWGWRVAVALGILVLPIGLWLRGTLPETLDEKIAATTAPLLASYARTAAIAFVTLLSATIVTYVLTYMTTYAKTTLRLGSMVAFGATVAMGAAFMIGACLAGIVSDRYGRRPLMIWPSALAAIGILPGYWLMVHVPGAATLWTVTFILRLLTILGSTASFIYVAETFPPRIRSGAIAIVYAVAISVFGGTTQFVIAWLTEKTGNPLAPAWYMFVAALVGLAAVAFARESAPGLREGTRDEPLG